MGNSTLPESRTTRLRNRISDGIVAFRGLHVPLRLGNGNDTVPEASRRQHQGPEPVRSQSRRFQKRRLDEDEQTGALSKPEHRRSKSLPTSPQSLKTLPDLTRHFRERGREHGEQEIETWSTSVAGTRKSSRNVATIANPNALPLPGLVKSPAWAKMQPPKCPDCRVPFGSGSGGIGPVTGVCATCHRFVSRLTTALVSPQLSAQTPCEEMAPTAHTETQSRRDQESRLLRGTKTHVPRRTTNPRSNLPTRRQELEVPLSLQRSPVSESAVHPWDALHDTGDSSSLRSAHRYRLVHNLIEHLQLRTNDLAGRARDARNRVEELERSAIDFLHDYDFLRESQTVEEPSSSRSSRLEGVSQVPLTDGSPPDRALAAAQKALLDDFYASEGVKVPSSDEEEEESSESDSYYSSRSDFGFPILQSVERIARGAIRAAQALEFEDTGQVDQHGAGPTGKSQAGFPPALRFDQSGQILDDEDIRQETPLKEDGSTALDSEKPKPRGLRPPDAL
ncbi:hypothetical protein BU16DRAFT_247248 [Lophium mytilinum]|uniref:Uncharacterized protein n=1 Tax=Lophium mytilinum TaxID=390894 RepID=A0A6A6R786_9PEZI|nr:hypothetical protein BU16DRAFT_247248 [Lophium mytilinum]